MALVAKDSGNERVLPKPGLHKAVCIDVYDAGYEESPWGPKEKLYVWWELDEQHPDFEGPFRINCKYTRSLSERANLSKALESWRGKGLTQQERKDGIDLEKLIGVGCQINVIHHESKSGKMWANVGAIMPLAREEWPKPSGHYTRQTDRDANGRPPEAPAAQRSEEEARQRYGGTPYPTPKPSQGPPTPPVEAYDDDVYRQPSSPVVDERGFPQDDLPF